MKNKKKTRKKGMVTISSPDILVRPPSCHTLQTSEPHLFAPAPGSHYRSRCHVPILHHLAKFLDLSPGGLACSASPAVAALPCLLRQVRPASHDACTRSTLVTPSRGFQVQLHVSDTLASFAACFFLSTCAEVPENYDSPSSLRADLAASRCFAAPGKARLTVSSPACHYVAQPYLLP